MYSTEVKKTEVLAESFRRAIGKLSSFDQFLPALYFERGPEFSSYCCDHYSSSGIGLFCAKW